MRSRKQIRSELLDRSEITTLVRRKMEREKLHLQAASALSGVSAPTLSRIIRGKGTPDIVTVTRLASWLGVPVERFVAKTRREGVHEIPHGPSETTEEVVEAHLRVDPNLSEETAKALSETFRVIYQQFLSARKASANASTLVRKNRGHGESIRGLD
jgi:transcriptional regulator with XRE-family HTH domain